LYFEEEQEEDDVGSCPKAPLPYLPSSAARELVAEHTGYASTKFKTGNSQ